jgi:hypothetical protein
MPKRNLGPRAEYRHQESQRVNRSVTLAEKFPQLRSLTVDLEFGSADGRGQQNQLKYVVNLANARSVFRFDCPNKECVGGDFDLSSQICNAYTQQHATAVGKLVCQGWRSKATMGSCRCEHILHYKLDLGYEDSLLHEER